MARRSIEQPDRGRQVERKNEKEQGQHTRLYVKASRARVWCRLCIQFCSPREPTSAPFHLCWGSPSKVDEFELAGCAKSPQNRPSREHRRAVPAQWVSEGDQK